jgi:modulator of FtsH protease HflK
MPASHQFNPDDPHQPEQDGFEQFEPDALDVEAPRRAASAQFVVDSDVGSEAALREAMDPANQSLADALRLSFRVLQLVILVLVVLFFASGFQTVDEGQSGVLTRWGRIIEVDGKQALEPGLRFSGWPYPVSEFVIIDRDNRQVTLRDPETRREPFWPNLRGRSLEEATQSATIHDPPRPENDGYVLTRDGDIAHMRLSAVYQIDNPVEFVNNLPDAKADRLVELALQRAAIHVAASVSLQELIDLSEEVRTRIQSEAQQVLDQMRCGIELATVSVADPTPALAIRKSFGDVQTARVEAERSVASAKTRAERVLVRAAGEAGRRVFAQIYAYEEALRLGESERAEALLAEINTRFESDEISGEVATIMHRARAFRSHVESSLGSEARRFASLLPIFRDHPELVIPREWLEVYGRVLSRDDAEIYFVPRGVGGVQLILAGLHEIKELRQQRELDRKEQEAYRGFFDQDGPYIMRGSDMIYDRAGRQLEIDDGRARGRGRQP